MSIDFQNGSSFFRMPPSSRIWGAVAATALLMPGHIMCRNSFSMPMTHCSKLWPSHSPWHLFTKRALKLAMASIVSRKIGKFGGWSAAGPPESWSPTV